ncbi:MAG: hypothetical protein AAF667_00655 [Pseudomonadota bacterium]
MPAPASLRRGRLVAIALLPLASVSSAGSGFAEISLGELDAGDLTTRFLALVMIALVIERAVEIYIKARFGPPELRPTGDGLSSAKRQRARAAHAAAGILSLAVAAVGIRVLAQFLPGGSADLAPSQRLAFQTVDMVLTTLVLAGGAEGIHRMARRISSAKP